MQKATIYVDHLTQQWVVRDPEGNFWVLPNSENPWDDRQPFDLSECSDLEPVPGHYRHFLSLPY
jgi:hypothetical protein